MRKWRRSEKIDHVSAELSPVHDPCDQEAALRFAIVGRRWPKVCKAQKAPGVLESNHRAVRRRRRPQSQPPLRKCVCQRTFHKKKRHQHHQHHTLPLRRRAQHVQHSTRIVPEKVYEFRESALIGFQTAQLMWLSRKSAVSTRRRAPSKKSIIAIAASKTPRVKAVIFYGGVATPTAESRRPETGPVLCLEELVSAGCSSPEPQASKRSRTKARGFTFCSPRYR